MSVLTEFRKTKDEFMSGDHQSPLTHDQQHGFSGLTYFDEDPAMQFVLQPEEFDDPVLAKMQTSTGNVAEYLRWGTVTCPTPRGRSL